MTVWSESWQDGGDSLDYTVKTLLMPKKSTLGATYIKYRTKLMRAVGSIVNMDDIEDIVQEAFLKSYEAELKQEIRYARTYMLITAKNLALNYAKSAASQQNQSMSDMDSLPHDLIGCSLEKHVESKERFINFCRATDTLSADVKRVFLLKKVYGMPQREIAQLIGISESTVEKHVAKGLLQCSKYLKTLAEEAPTRDSSFLPTQDKHSS